MSGHAKKEHKARFWTGMLSMALGLSLICGAGVLVAYNYHEDQVAGEFARLKTQQVENTIKASPMSIYLDNPEFIPDYQLNPDMEMPEAEIDGYVYVGQLEIPALELDLGVQSGWDYEMLRRSPCRYKGTPYTGTFVICAHNYKTHFGPLKNLEAGDSVRFTDMDGNVFDYAVVQVDEVKPDDDRVVTEQGYDLVLFTCTLGGRTRVAVYCDKA